MIAALKRAYNMRVHGRPSTLRNIVKRAGTLAFLFAAFCSQLPAAVDYDIVYVRWPRKGPDVLVELPQAEDPYKVEPGADLVLLHPDGTQDVLVDCDACCVQDPVVSLDGEWVFYTKVANARDRLAPSLLYKMHIAGSAPDFFEVPLTEDDGFPPELAAEFGQRDMGPCPLPGGGLAFTSNRHATIAARQGTWRSVSTASRSTTMDLYVLSADYQSGNRSIVRRIGYASMHMALHPVTLTDGRILFSNWDDAGGKFSYGMTTLYSIRPDGSGLRQVTEPHDRHKRVDHFATQLSSGDVVVGQYYPGRDFGYGILARFDPAEKSIEFQRDPSPQKSTHDDSRISFRSFERRDWEIMTPHTWARDCPAPNDSGKYAMPAATPGGGMLVAYSPGGVNYFSGCNGRDYLRSGIYLVPNASSAVVTDPAQLVEVLNSPEHNEIWPRPVVSYREIYGVDEPARIKAKRDDRIAPGKRVAIVGSSSLYNRESTPIGGDPFRNSTSRELHSGNWRIQGADSGVVSDRDIQSVRIIVSVQKPFRSPISRRNPSTANAHAKVRHLLHDRRFDSFVEGYASVHGERWKILAEIPVRKQGVVDSRGDPDTSFHAKIPANTPFFFQGLDADGLTLFSELTWRSAIPGENRTDCGGCHAHTVESVPFEKTAAGRREVPVFDATGEGFGVEYHRDVLPILNRCASCHSGTNPLVLDGTGAAEDPYFRLVLDERAKFGGKPPAGRSTYSYPQLTRYVRALQSRQSLLVWALFGRRLDGRTDADRDDDLDFTPCLGPHGATKEEALTIARWVDLGCPRDFLGDEHAGYRYTDVAPTQTINPKEILVFKVTYQIIDRIEGDVSRVSIDFTSRFEAPSESDLRAAIAVRHPTWRVLKVEVIQ